MVSSLLPLLNCCLLLNVIRSQFDLQTSCQIFSSPFADSERGPDHRDTKPAFNVGPSSAIEMASCWRADDGPFIAVFGSSIPSSAKKSYQFWTPTDKTSGMIPT